MRPWQTWLRFFDAHPWFFPTVAAVITIIGGLYTLSRLAVRMIRGWLERREEKAVIEYLATQLNPPGPRRDSAGGIIPRQLDCTLRDIARVVKKKPVRVLTILKRLKQQRRVEGDEYWWRISDHELDGRE